MLWRKVRKQKGRSDGVMGEESGDGKYRGLKKIIWRLDNRKDGY